LGAGEFRRVRQGAVVIRPSDRSSSGPHSHVGRGPGGSHHGQEPRAHGPGSECEGSTAQREASTRSGETPSGEATTAPPEVLSGSLSAGPTLIRRARVDKRDIVRLPGVVWRPVTRVVVRRPISGLVIRWPVSCGAARGLPIGLRDVPWTIVAASLHLSLARLSSTWRLDDEPVPSSPQHSSEPTAGRSGREPFVNARPAHPGCQ
jgi:hypothetical protein